MRRRIGSRVGVVVAAAGLAAAVCGAGPAVAAGDSGSRTVAVQACPDESTGPGMPPLKALAAQVTLPDGVTLPPGAAVFGARYPGDAQYVVAPGGWTCDVVFFAGDGGEQVYVHPGAHAADPPGASFTSLVQAVFDSGGVQTDVDLACPFIPQAVPPGGQCLAPPRQSADVVHAVRTGDPHLYAAAVSVPAGTREPNLAASGQAPAGTPPGRVFALVTLAGTGGAAQSISCALPGPAAASTCQAALGYLLATSATGQRLSAGRLSAALTDLNGFVASQAH
ncbi:hypothetical protein PUR71_23200 [Streptomyces sp. SP17BM10]|uniref:hypothetical protein n=1 Tax=Streptomyces sp. SP17BM10 TaxID=3002530 RepID=UPI002E783254|nr:hypothetical protein [Streptomyces sp. SP17BM10]MEE1785788.1 hypothetical protein [Streptomyces sp. SP17BM10]